MKVFFYISLFVFSSSVFASDFQTYFDDVDESYQYLKEKTEYNPKLLIVLTAGIEGPLALLEDKVIISTSDIPHFPKAQVKGHTGQLIFGKLNGIEIVLMKGRNHYYEGISAQKVVFPYFVLNKLGVQSVITMNAVGGIRYDLEAGDIMLVTDHINYLWDNSLRGLAIQHQEKQFTPMADAYDLEYRDIAHINAQQLNIDLKEGTYLATMGPNYETGSEIQMFRIFGADAVGMSTVFEVLACRFLEMRVLAFCCIANPAADKHEGQISHEEVLDALNKMGPKLSELVNSCAKEIITY